MRHDKLEKVWCPEHAFFLIHSSLFCVYLISFVFCVFMPYYRYAVLKVIIRLYVSFVGRLLFTVLKDVSSESCLYLTPLEFFYTLGLFLRKKKILGSWMPVLDYYGWHICPTDFSACRQYRNILSNFWDATQEQAAGGGQWRYCCLCNITNVCMDIYRCR